jgi:hypothetical protein
MPNQSKINFLDVGTFYYLRTIYIIRPSPFVKLKFALFAKCNLPLNQYKTSVLLLIVCSNYYTYTQ